MLTIPETTQMWKPLSDALIVPQTEEQYDRLVQWLDSLIDAIGEDETHPLASLMDVLGVLIERYEDIYVPELVVAS